jgi:DNA-binding MarR family transcriptional regulator
MPGRKTIMTEKADRVPDPYSGADLAQYTESFVSGVAAQMPDADAEAMRLIFLLIRVGSLVLYDLESGAHRANGLTAASFQLLLVLWINGPCENIKAAALAGTSRAAVSALSNTLTRAGLMDKQLSPNDRRSVVLALTDLGLKTVRETFAAVNRREIGWSQVLSAPERVTLETLLTKLSTGHESMLTRK